MSALTADRIASFHREGYLVFDSLFSDEECRQFKADIDHLEQLRRDRQPTPFLCEFPHLGPLISHPHVMELLEELLGPGFAFHHLHATRQDAGTRGVHWHQDYEQFPHSNRSHLMVHFFYYFSGLNGEVGDLLLVPRTQQTVVDNGALSFLGTANLPGTLVLDDLPPGTGVLVHSALWHARRAKPGGEGHPRYFVDASYCQAGIRWPSYGARHWRDILDRARELNLDRDGRYAHLFDPAHFFDEIAARNLVRGKQGSLVLELNDWKEDEQEDERESH
jgi:hypothetical protein